MNRLVRRHDGPATWDSSVRGLMLGLALGDAIGSRASDLPETGVLEAGVATQLAAWTTEGLLRTATRYGGHVLGNPHGRACSTPTSAGRFCAARRPRPTTGFRSRSPATWPPVGG